MNKDYLPQKQQQILQTIGTVMSERNFYLAGGTALAIYYEHRMSVDLDWFTGDQLGDAMQLASSLQSSLPLEVTSVSPGTLYAMSGQVQLSFMEYRYPLLQPLVSSDEFGCHLAALDDIACMKLSAVAQRGARKDFIDVYTLVQQHRPLSELLKLYQRKYSVQDISSVLYGLAYFNDAEREPLPERWNGNWKEVTSSFHQWLKAIV
ncbi:MAG: nucleotidyl transferase AbiEii/AbiGii toxin family protein [Chloroflexi bacterium]|nr:nucleotidyl transferase AbiEii/AbiGii toxin family protein [Chloroflexota bacterium]